ncbi:MAG: hypothetical protein IT360_16925 [Gemmatimonadaceae bacterium]|nr:hypothetical protein [Gemmatimonadaceae bacterium]
MHGMQLSLFADADREVAPAPTPRARRSIRPSLASRVAAMHAAQDTDAHAVAVDAALTIATPRIVRIARLFVPSWPVAHVEVEDLTQEALLEVAASLHLAPCASDEHTQAWLSALVMQVLHELWRVAAREAVDHRDAVAAFAVELEPDAAALRLEDTDAADDEHVDPSVQLHAA